MDKDEMKNKISMALKDPILQQGFEIICKENAELKSDMLRKNDFQSWFKENIPDEGLSENTTFSKQFVEDAWDNGYLTGLKKGERMARNRK